MKSYMAGEKNRPHDRESETLRISDMLRCFKLLESHPVVRVCDPVELLSVDSRFVVKRFSCAVPQTENRRSSLT
jgi:hypothetical protein